MGQFTISFAPFVPIWLLVVLAAVVAVVTAVGLLARQKGAILRLIAFALLLAALANPSLVSLDRDKLKDVVAVVVDRSGSQTLGTRQTDTDRALAEVKRQLDARPHTEVRVIEATDRDRDGDGTRLFDALQTGLSDTPPERVAGVIAITDGRVHDIPGAASALGFAAPFHALITGRADERDRRLEVIEGPRFGIVGKDAMVAVRVIDAGIPARQPAEVTIKVGGQVIGRRTAQPGQILRFGVRVAHAGLNLVEIEAAPLEGELTLLNNTAHLQVEGVRDRLKVLLVSGEPHAGERTWRNLLKADGNVELVHFTILRPPEKQDGTPINELALIAFPTRELFIQKIAEFDLIIFDRYANQSILPAIYFENIAKYVREGGAVLVAAGSEMAGPTSLATTPLAQILPARPSGGQLERAFLPRVSPLGERHPVGRDLPGWNAERPQWAPWFRLVRAIPRGGQAVMQGPDAAPLLVLDRVEKGRVALLLSDHAWLWARGFGEGGPYIDMLRRLVHWLMKEPELDEEALRMTARGRSLQIERQTLAQAAGDFTLVGPDGEEFRLTPTEAQPGLFRTSFTARRPGLHRVTNGDKVAFAHVGPANPREFTDVTSSEGPLSQLAEATGGNSRRLFEGNTLTIPRIVDIRSGGRFAGRDFIGLKPSEAYVVKGVSLLPLALGFLGLLLLVAALIATWLREGRGRRASFG